MNEELSMAHYILIGESKFCNEPDIEFNSKIDLDIIDARAKAINILSSPKYKDRFWAVSIFKNDRFIGAVDRTDKSYRYTSKGKSVRLYKDGTVRV